MCRSEQEDCHECSIRGGPLAAEASLLIPDRPFLTGLEGPIRNVSFPNPCRVKPNQRQAICYSVVSNIQVLSWVPVHRFAGDGPNSLRESSSIKGICGRVPRCVGCSGRVRLAPLRIGSQCLLTGQ